MDSTSSTFLMQQERDLRFGTTIATPLSMHGLSRTSRSPKWFTAATSPTLMEPGQPSRHEPNIADFLKATGQSMQKMSIGDLKKYTNHDLLRISAKWSNQVSKKMVDQKEDQTMFDDQSIKTLTASLSADCAKLEVEAIALLSEIESEASHASRIPIDNSEEEDEDLEVEIQVLDRIQDFLGQELEDLEHYLKFPRKRRRISKERSEDTGREEPDRV